MDRQCENGILPQTQFAGGINTYEKTDIRSPDSEL